MTDKSLEKKAVKIKNKSYVLVSDRVIYFNENYKDGYIQSQLIRWEDDIIVVKATIVPDVSTPERKFVDYAQEKVGDGYINKTSALENACTSAVGRALAMMGIGVIDSIASVDEINKAENRSKATPRKFSPNDLFVKCDFKDKKTQATLKDINGKWIPEKKIWHVYGTDENKQVLSLIPDIEVFGPKGTKIDLEKDAAVESFEKEIIQGVQPPDFPLDK